MTVSDQNAKWHAPLQLVRFAPNIRRVSARSVTSYGCRQIAPRQEGLSIACLDDNRSIIFDLPARVFVARDLFERGSVLLKAREIVARPIGRTFNGFYGCVQHHDRDEHRAVQHGELHVPHSLVGRDGDR